MQFQVTTVCAAQNLLKVKMNTPKLTILGCNNNKHSCSFFAKKYLCNKSKNKYLKKTKTRDSAPTIELRKNCFHRDFQKKPIMF